MKPAYGPSPKYKKLLRELIGVPKKVHEKLQGVQIVQVWIDEAYTWCY